MGVKITELIPAKQIGFADLAGKIIVVDASLFLYQFLTTIRQPDGAPLMDSNGHVTSHLVGLFSRTAKLMQYGIRLAYVFDGPPPKLKVPEQLRRSAAKMIAKERYEHAAELEDVDGMKKYAGRTSRLSPEMVSEAKALVAAMGLPVIQAPSEAEAQAASIVRAGNAFALATQDADSLMFGSDRIIKNLSFIGKKKLPNKLSSQTIEPEMIVLEDVLSTLGISQDQLICLCMLVGTDYNPGGIKGIGQKGALKIVKEFGADFDKMFISAGWNSSFPDMPWKLVFDTVKEMPVSSDYELIWHSVDDKLIIRLLVEQHNFSEERTLSTLAKLTDKRDLQSQKGLGDFF